MPGVSSAAVVWNPDRPDNKPELDAMQAESQQLGVELQSVQVHTSAELASALDILRAARIDALLNLGDNLLSRARQHSSSASPPNSAYHQCTKTASTQTWAV